MGPEAGKWFGVPFGAPNLGARKFRTHSAKENCRSKYIWAASREAPLTKGALRLSVLEKGHWMRRGLFAPRNKLIYARGREHAFYYHLKQAQALPGPA